MVLITTTSQLKWKIGRKHQLRHLLDVTIELKKMAFHEFKNMKYQGF